MQLRMSSGDVEAQNDRIQEFYEKAATLLNDFGGELDSLQFGRKWRAAFPEDDLDSYRQAGWIFRCIFCLWTPL
jgi:hypothetical protein